MVILIRCYDEETNNIHIVITHFSHFLYIGLHGRNRRGYTCDTVYSTAKETKINLDNLAELPKTEYTEYMTLLFSGVRNSETVMEINPMCFSASTTSRGLNTFGKVPSLPCQRFN